MQIQESRFSRSSKYIPVELRSWRRRGEGIMDQFLEFFVGLVFRERGKRFTDGSIVPMLHRRVGLVESLPEGRAEGVQVAMDCPEIAQFI